MKMANVLPLFTWRVSLFPVVLLFITSLYYVNTLTSFFAEAGIVSFPFIHNVPYWVCCGDTEWYWFSCPPGIWPWLLPCSLHLFVFSTPPTPTFSTSPSQAVLQGSTAGTAPRSVAAKTAQTVTTSLASVPAEQASSGRAVSRVE